MTCQIIPKSSAMLGASSFCDHLSDSVIVSSYLHLLPTQELVLSWNLVSTAPECSMLWPHLNRPPEHLWRLCKSTSSEPSQIWPYIVCSKLLVLPSWTQKYHPGSFRVWGASWLEYSFWTHISPLGSFFSRLNLAYQNEEATQQPQ